MKTDEGFSYTYSAYEQEEIKRIREKYIEKEKSVSKLDIIKKLDKSVTDTATIVAILLGVLGSLVLGTGMSMVMVWGSNLFVPGIFVGVLGIAMIAAAYPVFNIVVSCKRKKIAPEILRLTDELIDQ